MINQILDASLMNYYKIVQKLRFYSQVGQSLEILRTLKKKFKL